MKQLSLLKPLTVIALCITVSGCLYGNSGSSMSTDQSMSAEQAAAANEAGTTQAPEEVRAAASGGALGGYIEQFMDAKDKAKMARALDGSLGKATTWQNAVSGATFSVTPISKVSNGSGICRAYSVTMNKSGVNDRVGGTACIGDDGAWHVAG